MASPRCSARASAHDGSRNTDNAPPRSQPEEHSRRQCAGREMCSIWVLQVASTIPRQILFQLVICKRSRHLTRRRKPVCVLFDCCVRDEALTGQGDGLLSARSTLRIQSGWHECRTIGVHIVAVRAINSREPASGVISGDGPSLQRIWNRSPKRQADLANTRRTQLRHSSREFHGQGGDRTLQQRTRASSPAIRGCR